MKKTIQYQNGSTLSYADFGNPHGDAVLVQHGLIASIGDEHLFDSLVQRGARVICIARPGYGASSPYAMKNIGEWGEIAAALVDALGLARFDVLGISSGAPYSYAIGYALAQRVRNIYILSGTPALYDESVRACWPYPVNPNASIAEMQALAHELFFAHLLPADREQADIKDSMANEAFGVAQDLRIRVMDWGFRLADVPARVMMRHSRVDGSVPWITAEMTSRLLPNCALETRENDPHFSPEVLDDFIASVFPARKA